MLQVRVHCSGYGVLYIYDVNMTPRQKLEPVMESQNGLCLECWPNVAEPNVLLQCTSGAATEDGLPSSVSS